MKCILKGEAFGDVSAWVLARFLTSQHTDYLSNFGGSRINSGKLESFGGGNCNLLRRDGIGHPYAQFGVH